MEPTTKKTWQKAVVSDAVKRTKNPIRGWIENSLSKIKPDPSKKPIVFTVGDPAIYAGFEPSARFKAWLTLSAIPMATRTLMAPRTAVSTSLSSIPQTNGN